MACKKENDKKIIIIFLSLKKRNSISDIGFLFFQNKIKNNTIVFFWRKKINDHKKRIRKK
jgi:hypothetical protein